MRKFNPSFKHNFNVIEERMDAAHEPRVATSFSSDNFNFLKREEFVRRSHFLVLLLFLGGCFVSAPIREALSDDAKRHPIGAIHIFATKRRTVRITEVELSKVAVQMLLAAVLVNALHASLENRVISFNCVRVDFR